MFSTDLSTESDVFHSNNFFPFLNLYNVLVIAKNEFNADVGKNVSSILFLKKVPLIPEIFL